MSVKIDFSPKALEEVLSNIKESELVFCLEVDGIWFYVAHTHFTDPRIPITVSIPVRKQGQDASPTLCMLQNGWLDEEKVREAIHEGRAGLH